MLFSNCDCCFFPFISIGEYFAARKKASRTTIGHFDNFVFDSGFKALMGTSRNNNNNYNSYMNNMKKYFHVHCCLKKITIGLLILKEMKILFFFNLPRNLSFHRYTT